jgi:hypothetical protein
MSKTYFAAGRNSPCKWHCLEGKVDIWYPVLGRSTVSTASDIGKVNPPYLRAIHGKPLEICDVFLVIV